MWLTLLSLFCRLFGLAEWLDGLLKARAAKRKAQAAADAPTTDKEFMDAAKKGDL